MITKNIGIKMLTIMIVGMSHLYAEGNTTVSSASAVVKKHNSADEAEAKKAKWRKMVDNMSSEKFKTDMHKKEKKRHEQWVENYKDDVKAQNTQKKLGQNSKHYHVDRESKRKLQKDMNDTKIKG